MSNDEKYGLSRRKALLGLGTIGAAGAGAGFGTSALFSDTETFTNNRIQAGTTNLIAELGLVDIVSSAPDEVGVSLDVGDTATADGEAVSMGLTVDDMKPGDCIILRSTARVEANPMYVALDAENVANYENGLTEPEGDVDSSGGDPGVGNGELGDNLEITFGWESVRTGGLHDNALDGSINPDPNGELLGSAFLGNLNGGYLYRGRNAADGSPPGGHGGDGDLPTRIGNTSENNNADRDAVTHFIEICLPEGVGNVVQGDSIEFDLVWSAEQVRNNSDPENSTQVDGNVNFGNA
jgi:predicted ribosomally synthesized peptide with SipW-like signal peptide